MDREAHIERHKLLHNHLDELIADFISHTKRLPSTTLLDHFMKWSHEQILMPSDPHECEHNC